MAQSPVDLRSDTVTRPTEAMRTAMARAEVGDDFYGEDPTVTQLEENVAELTGTEAAVLVVGGTMANLTALMALTDPGDLVVAEHDSDLVRWESHATAAVAGVQLHPVTGRRGVLDPDETASILAQDDWRAPRAGLVALENSHCASGGEVWSLVEIDALLGSAGTVPVLCDGARLLNAAVSAGYSPAEVGARCTALTLSLYKGLGAPMGALVCGPKEVVDKARWARRMLGATFRQAGLVAAAGLIALSSWRRLADDHEAARRLHEGMVERFPEGVVTRRPPATNIVVLRLGSEAAAFVEQLSREDVLVTEIVPGVVRFVTHRDLGDTAVEQVLAATDKVLDRATSARREGSVR